MRNNRLDGYSKLLVNADKSDPKIMAHSFKDAKVQPAGHAQTAAAAKRSGCHGSGSG